LPIEEFVDCKSPIDGLADRRSPSPIVNPSIANRQSPIRRSPIANRQSTIDCWSRSSPHTDNPPPHRTAMLRSPDAAAADVQHPLIQRSGSPAPAD